MRSSRPLRCVLPWLSGVLILGLVGIAVEQPVHAQVLYGSVVGGVTDQSDASVPNSTVTLTSKETGQSRDTTSDASGRYSFVNVLPGRYDIKVVGAGFRTFT